MNGEHGGPYHDRKTRKGFPGLEMQAALYTQKHNRYVSLTTGTTPQILITKPVKVTGKTLQLNVDASRGDVKVGIGIDKTIVIFDTVAQLPNYMVRDRQGETHLENGFRIKDCTAIGADSIQHDVEWKGGSLETQFGKTVRLYIMMQDADLYGFRFK